MIEPTQIHEADSSRTIGLSEPAAIDHLIVRAMAYAKRPSISRKRALIRAIDTTLKLYSNPTRSTR